MYQRTLESDIPLQTTSQSELYRMQELTANKIDHAVIRKVLFADPDWPKAHQVLDVGCGYGDQLNQLAPIEPKKFFIGIDKDREALRKAPRTCPNLLFRQADIESETFQGFYDIVFAKHIIEQTGDVDRFMKFCWKQLRPNGSLVLIARHLPLCRLMPAIPELTDLYYGLEDSSMNTERISGALSQVIKEAKFFGFNVEANMTISGNTDEDFSKQDLATMHTWVTRCFSQRFTADTPRIESKINDWLENPSAYGQMGYHYIKLRKNVG